MRFKGHEKIRILAAEAGTVEAVAPIIVSASRSTDIPAYHAEHFFNAWEKGYTVLANPFNQKKQYLSFQKTRAVVFWTKDPAPLLPFLHELEKKKIFYYFQFTLNDYEEEGLEPFLKPLEERINTFIKLSGLIGPARTVWRFDPLLRTPSLTLKKLLERIEKLADRLFPFTERLVISFIDLEPYPKVQNRLKRTGRICLELTPEETVQTARFLMEKNRRWGLDIRTCAEKADLEEYGIRKNKCVDDALLKKTAEEDGELADFLKQEGLKDRGQRRECRCIPSKDISMYGTCRAGCLYCYAT